MMTAVELHTRFQALPNVLQHAVVLFLLADERQRRVIESMGQYGSLEIHWDQSEMKLYPRHKLLMMKRDMLTIE